MNYPHDVYAQAQKADDEINRFLEECPLTPTTVKHWRLFIRTVMSGLLMMEKKLNKEYPCDPDNIAPPCPPEDRRR